MASTSAPNKWRHKKRYRWSDGEGRALSAGGILVHDQSGLWLLEETDRGKLTLSDFGGKYSLDDGDIFATIAREFSEELYHSSELTRRQVESLYSRVPHFYLRDSIGEDTYLCLLVSVTELARLGVKLSPKAFDARHIEVLKGNPGVPLSDFPSVSLKYFPLSQIHKMMNNKSIYLGSRVTKILQNKGIFSKIKSSTWPVVRGTSA